MDAKTFSDKFIYAINAMFYCLWRFDVTSSNRLNNIFKWLTTFIPKHFYSEDSRERFFEKYNRTIREYDRARYNRKYGEHIGRTKYLFGYMYSSYPAIISCVAVGLYWVISGLWNNNSIIKLILIGIPIGICYIPAYKALYTNDRYLAYFKEFDKEDNNWYRRWKRRTILFIIGSIISTIVGYALFYWILVFFRA